jgi:sulfatase maturation enzyme AslB (radical SAM superfamily)
MRNNPRKGPRWDQAAIRREVPAIPLEQINLRDLLYQSAAQDILRTEMRESNTFCIAPYIHSHVRSDVLQPYFAVCCYAGSGILDEKGRALRLTEVTEEDAFNSPHVRQVREEQASGKWPAGCRYCMDKEKSTGKSPRIDLNQKWLEKLNTEPESFINVAEQSGWCFKYEPVWVSISLGNQCNLACRICSSMHSRRIGNDPTMRAWSADPEMKKSPIGPKAFSALNASAYLSVLKKPQLIRQLYLTGGEPFSEILFPNIMRWLIDHGDIYNCEIILHTNGTIYNKNIVGLLSKLPNLSIAVSMDGVASMYEYMRYPAKWDSFISTLERLRSSLPQAGFMLAPTMSISNIDDFGAIIDFAKAHHLRISESLLTYPKYLSPLALPDLIRKEYASKCRLLGLNLLAHELETMPVYDPAIEIPRFFEFTRQMDAARAQNWLSMSPEVNDHLKAAGYEFAPEIDLPPHTYPVDPTGSQDSAQTGAEVDDVQGAASTDLTGPAIGETNAGKSLTARLVGTLRCEGLNDFPGFERELVFLSAGEGAYELRAGEPGEGGYEFWRLEIDNGRFTATGEYIEGGPELKVGNLAGDITGDRLSGEGMRGPRTCQLGAVFTD